MDNSLKPYEEYKRVDLPWIDFIPKHWDVKRSKTMYRTINVRSTTGIEELLSVSSNYGVVKRKNANVTMFKAESYVGYKLCWEQDLAVNSLWAWQKGLGFSQYHGIISTAYSVYRLKDNINFNYRYYDYFVRSEDYLWELKTRSKGIWKSRYQLSDQSFLDSPMLIPSRDEQDQVVRYLDWKLAKINKFIKAKKKQIGLLKEQKQAIINEAVTKGIDPNVSLKESGIKCAGLIPKHWSPYQLGKVAKIILSGLDKKSYEGQQSILLCNYVDVYKNENITDVLSFMKATASEAELATLKLRKDDVIITKDSESWDDIGVPAYVSQEIENLYCGYHLAILRTNKSLVFGEYLYNAFRSQYVQIQHKVKAKGVTRFALGYQPIHDTVLLIPPIEEQKAIVEKIRMDCSIQDTFIIKLKKEIELLLEYKTSLISDVVTGKVDVRGMKVEVVDEMIEDFDEINEDMMVEKEMEIVEEG